ncbi:hypothetical protein BBJ29_007026 [Phytophthora kernoviae]|uniref:Uncharacterized protein n=1 Tax=Phytophthora kernoviae TaxID=325452 RepID=A0A3F2RMB6_9STRA|nr:hypothetical protein BBJ29_007026 [Phytophthora kernoviae]RLN60436.1 hypothetical protein BBP00_00005982 [Phytophthora kernoviae]
MEQALQLPRLHLDTFVAQPRFLEPIDPPTVPFPPPTWCLHKPPRAISLLDVYKDHVLIATASSDQSGSTADLSVYLDDPADEQQGEPKRVHFCGQPPEIIPDAMDEGSEEPIDIDSDAVQVRENLQRTDLANTD